MRILFTAFDVVPAPKGASVRIQQMLKALSALGQVRACLLGEAHFPEQELSEEGVEIQRLIVPQESFLARSVQFAEFVLENVLRWQPDVVQFRSLWDAYPLMRYFEGQSRRPQWVYELHGLPEYELEHHFPDFPVPLLNKIRQQQAYVFSQADAVICPSQVHMEYIQNEVQAQIQKTLPLAWVPNGVDLSPYTPLPQSVSQDPPIILYVGTLAPWQGLEPFLESLQAVRQPFRLRLIGKGQRRWVQDLLTRAFQLKLAHLIELLEPLPHECMPAAILEADICVAPLDASNRNVKQGCMPLKILEYMAAGKAVLASDLPVVHPLLNSENAWLLPPEDQLAWTRCLENVLSQPALREARGKAARETVKQWTWQKSQAYLQRFYADVLGFPILNSL